MTQSTAEAEYVAAAEAAKEMVWTRRLVQEMIGQVETPVLHVDNQSPIKLVHNPAMHQFTKHIDIRYHYIREVVEKEIFKTEDVNTKEQLADIFTKPLM